MQQNNYFKIRDKRKSNRFYIDNEYLNGYAKEIRWQGSLVYMALCRHAKNESCFPSIAHLAIELGIGKTSVKAGLKKLKEFKIIALKQRVRTTKGRGSNVYYLLDRKEWKPAFRWSNREKKEG